MASKEEHRVFRYVIKLVVLSDGKVALLERESRHIPPRLEAAIYTDFERGLLWTGVWREYAVYLDASGQAVGLPIGCFNGKPFRSS